MSNIVAVLDACVLYSAPLRDFLLNLATQKLYQPKWSEKINEEWTRNLLKNRPDLNIESIENTIKLMNDTYRSANVKEINDYSEFLQKLDLPDKDDRHVLATAILSEAKFIVTFNLKDFPSDKLEMYNVNSISPDDFCLLLFEIDSETVKEGFLNQLRTLKNPPLSVQKLLENLEKVGLSQTVKKLS
jgi:predicted nucleic acid-binding protein